MTEMSTNYLSYFGLNDDPFRMTPDTAYFYNYPVHATALLSLDYCIKEKEGFCIVTGEPGTGKSTIVRVFTERWKDKAEIALTISPRLSPEELFLAILEDFKIPLRSTSKNEMLKVFRDFLLKQARKERPVVIVVDEAQELPEDTLEELRLLSNLETEKEKLLLIVLIGQPELNDKLLSSCLRQLNQRITVRVHLNPLTASETSDYIGTRLIRGGNSSPLYSEKAKSLVYQLSGGVPRTINLLASRGLMSAFLEGSKEVVERHVSEGAKDAMGAVADKQPKEKTSLRRLQLSIYAATVLLVAGIGLIIYEKLSAEPRRKTTVSQAVEPRPSAAALGAEGFASMTGARRAAGGAK